MVLTVIPKTPLTKSENIITVGDFTAYWNITAAPIQFDTQNTILVPEDYTLRGTKGEGIPSRKTVVGGTTYNAYSELEGTVTMDMNLYSGAG